jgi:glycosyl transferase, family 25
MKKQADLGECGGALGASTWPSYVVNLDAASDRLQSIREVMAGEGITFTRIPAIAGSALTDEEIARSTGGGLRPRFKWVLSRGEIACYLSHMVAWRLIVEGDADAGFVFEDDVELVPGAGAILHAISNREPDWDILRLYSNKPRRLGHLQPIAGGFQMGVACKPPMATVGYAVTRQAARHLIETSLPFSRPLDMDLKLWWKNRLCGKVVVPSLCHPRVSLQTTSALDPERRAARGNSPWRRFFENMRYQIAYNLLVLRHHGQLPTARRVL